MSTPTARPVRLCLLGFGAVGRTFAELLAPRLAELEAVYGARVLLTGVFTPSRGALVDPAGLALPEVLEAAGEVDGFGGHPAYRPGLDALGTLEASAADVLIELSPLSVYDGQPAISYIEWALTHGIHVITANKGPEAHAYRRLRALADAGGLEYLHETAVMDGTPVFNLVERTLPGCEVVAIRGVLNSTTNFVLAELERGGTQEDAIRAAQAAGFAEADPSLDLDGWDGAAKITALANVLMGADLRPQDVDRVPLRVSAPDLAAARGRGATVKYVCTATRGEDGTLRLRVAPEEVPLSDPFALVSGTSSIITLVTDLAGPVTITQTDPGIEQTAYGVYSDLLSLLGRV